MFHPGRNRFRHRDHFVPPQGDFRPVDNLPTELLSRIFQLGIEDDLRGDLHASSCVALGNVNDNAATEDEINTEKEVEEGTGGVDSIDNGEKIGQSSRDPRLPCSFRIVVSHVCRHWRNAAISTASLWTSITISLVSRPPYQLVVALLERSKCLPIDVRVRFRPQERGVHSTFESTPFMADLELLYSLLVAQIHRWRSIEVKTVSIQQAYLFLCAVSFPTATAAPQLTSLVLIADPRATDRDDPFWSRIAGSLTLFSGSAPRLENVILERVYINWNQDWILSASRLTTLELLGHPDDVCPSWYEFTTILRGAPALERLVLHSSGPRGDPPNLDVDPNLEIEATARMSPIQLLKLTHLSLLCQPRTCVYGILRTLYMPALRSLTVNFFWDDYTEFLSYITAPATVPATLSAEERPRSLLRILETLDINCSFCTTEVIEPLYDELENVKSLKISMDKFWFGADSGCTLILPLLPPTSVDQGSVHLRLPRLQTLSISDASTSFHLEVIRQAVQRRNDVGFPLRSLYLEGTCDVDDENMVWFEGNIDKFVFSRQHPKR